MSPRNFRPGAPAPGRTIAPFHRGPQAIATPLGTSRPEGTIMTKNAALLIDFDNVTMGIRSDLHSELKTLLSSDIIKGKPAVQRAYADWRRYAQYVVPLAESSIDMIMAPAYGSSKKNATDIRLAIDALELVFTRPDVTTFILLSGDSDFSSLVVKLKEYGKYVIGIGIRESSSDLLVMNCDEYYSYNALAGLVKSSEDESTRWDPWQLVGESITRMKRNGDVMRSDRLKQVMQEIDNSFDEKDLGYPKFSRFVQEASQRGLLTMTKLDSGQLEVGLPPDGVERTTAGVDVAEPEVRRDRDRDRDRDRERDDRGRRRSRRGRGDSVAERGVEDEDREASPAVDHSVSSTDRVTAPAAEADEQPSSDIVESAGPSGETDTAVETDTEGSDRSRRRSRGRGRGRGRERSERSERATAEQTAEPAEDRPAHHDLTSVTSDRDQIGETGELLTRNEAFDLVRRAVESLVQGESTTVASAVRTRAFELLGRDSRSLSSRFLERVLQDAHDAGMIDLRRRGDDFEVARAADAPAIVEQLKSAEDAVKATEEANAPPPAPRGMSHRGVSPRGGSRGRSGAMPADLLMVGVVPRAGSPPMAPAGASAAATASASSTPSGNSSGNTRASAPSSSPPVVAAPSAPSANGSIKVPVAEADAPKVEEKSPAKKTARPRKRAKKTAAKTAVKTAANSPGATGTSSTTSAAKTATTKSATKKNDSSSAAAVKTPSKKSTAAKKSSKTAGRKSAARKTARKSASASAGAETSGKS